MRKTKNLTLYIFGLLLICAFAAFLCACSSETNTDNDGHTVEHTTHTYTNYVYNNDATCTHDGTETAKCDGCDKTDTRIKTNTKTGHSFTNYISNNDFTCTQDGTKTAKCDNCTETDTVAVIGSAKHTPKTAVKENDVPPTYDAEGSYDSVVRCKICDTVISTEHITVDKITLTGTDIYSKTLTMDGDTLRGTFPNGTTQFRFAGDITIAEGASYYLCSDIQGTQVIPTKIAPLKTGNNTFYLVVTNGNADPMTYTVILRVRPIYTVTFETNGGNSVASQSIEEDSTIDIAPTTAQTGYTFANWTVSDEIAVFPYTITENIIFSAMFTANEYTATLDVNGGDTLEQSEYPINYDDNFTFVTPTRTGYSFLGWYDDNTKVNDMTWKYTENKTFVAQWQINQYTVTLKRNNAAAGTVTGEGSYDYNSSVMITAITNDGYNFVGWYDSTDSLISENTKYAFTMGFDSTIYAKWDYYTVTTSKNYSSAGSVTSYSGTKISVGNSITITATGTNNLGYVWSGWYSDDELLTTDMSYTFTMTKENWNCTAKWYLWDGLEIFEFTSTPTTLMITGLKEKTLTEINVPYGTTSIDSSAFKGCSGLTSITIPDSVTSIGSSAFNGCSSLTDIIIPDSVTSIGSSAFYNCGGLTSITIPFVGDGKNNANFGYIFGASEYSRNSLCVPKSLSTVIISCNSVTLISGYAFYGCSGLTSITIPDSVTSIYNHAFYGCSGLTSITIPDSVTSISVYAFYGCSELSNVTIGDGVTSISDSAFESCSKLTSITIPNRVTSIGSYAFSGCSSLTSIIIPNSVTSIGSSAFYYCSRLASINVSNGNTEYYSDINCLIERKSNILIAGCKNSIIPNGVTSISGCAFGGCSGLTSITIPDSVTSIGNSAFRGCSSLTSITIPNSVTSIYNHAFYGCSGLTSITIGNGVASIGRYAFGGCSGLTSITIPDSVTSIYDHAFSDCNKLTSVKFENTANWYVQKMESAGSYYTDKTYISLSNTTTAAERLVSTYCNYYWGRS